jgi:hypothetical protein
MGLSAFKLEIFSNLKFSVRADLSNKEIKIKKLVSARKYPES